MNAASECASLGRDTIRLAQAAASAAGEKVVDVLEKQAGLAGGEFMAALAATFRLPLLDMAALLALSPAFERVSFHEALARACLVLKDGEGRVMAVIADPFDVALRAWLDERLRGRYSLHLAHRADIAARLSRHEQNLRAMDSVLAQAQQKDAATSVVENLSFRAIAEDTSPVVKLVSSTIYDALKANASDIHLESNPSGLVFKYRIDGVLLRVGNVSGAELSEQVISRIKVMSELDIAERRVPQDGRFRVSVNGREVDLRVSIMPSIHGEDAVLRILDKQALTEELRGLRLANLGFEERTVSLLHRLASEPYGMLLVTGPTGSGKTTTLYAALSEINRGQDKIVTIEDPVEYQLPGVLQIPVNEKKGLTFARGLRSILRHDPDKIMVGEIRDPETAQIAIQSALTGHLVFTTVHANNVFDVLGRFLHMGVDPYSFVSALNGILAQRLLRVNCPHCVQEDEPADDILAASGISPNAGRDFRFRSGRGCAHCRGSGYKGRQAIAEVLQLTDDIREMIVARAPIRQIKEAAQARGTRFLRQSALDLVARGLTTLQEINRVTFVS